MPQKIPFITDERSEMNYEYNVLIYKLIAPIMWVFSIWVMVKKMFFGKNLKTNIFFIDGLSRECRKVKDNAKNWKALDVLYNHNFEDDKGIEGATAAFWLKTINAQAMRNRLKLVNQCLREEIERLLPQAPEIKIFSIASGSAQGVIEILEEYKQKGAIVRAQLLDLDNSALEHAKILAQKAGVLDRLYFINKSSREIDPYIKNWRPQIIEMVGFLEYRSDSKTVSLIQRIYDLLDDNSVLLTSTVTPSAESFFLHHVINWPMIYRTPAQFERILQQTSFENIKIICEPLKMQKIAICRKNK